MTYFVCSEPAALGCVTYLAPRSYLLFLPLLHFESIGIPFSRHYRIIIAIILFLFFTPPSSMPTATPLGGRRWLCFEFPMRGRSVFSRERSYFSSACNTGTRLVFSFFFLHLL